MIAWLLAFVVTCATEIAVVRALVPRRRIAIVLCAQLATHPFVWIAMAALPGSQLMRLCGVELWATLLEAAIYARFMGLPRRDAFTVSAMANAASLLLVAALGYLLA